MEIFRWVIGYEDKYMISNKGTVKSFYKTVPPRILKVGINTKGYEAVYLCRGYKRETLTVHRLVAEAFIGKIGGLTINHKDGNKRNNNLENLEICTNQENIRHAVETGLLDNNGEKSGKAKHSDFSASLVIKLFKEGWSILHISKMMDFNYQFCWRVCNGDGFNNVTKLPRRKYGI